MLKSIEKIITVLSNTDRYLTKVQISDLGGNANKSKLRLLLKMGSIKRNKVMILKSPQDIEDILKETKLIKNDIKREKFVAKLRVKASKEKFYYTYELV